MTTFDVVIIWQISSSIISLFPCCKLSYLFVSFHVRIDGFVITVFSIDDIVIILNNTFWYITPWRYIPFPIFILFWINQNKLLQNLVLFLYLFFAFLFSFIWFWNSFLRRFVINKTSYFMILYFLVLCFGFWFLVFGFNSLWVSFGVKVTRRKYNFACVRVKIILSEIILASWAQNAGKIRQFFYLSFNSNLKLINAILSDLQKLLRCFHTTAVVVFLKIPFAPLSSVLFSILTLYLKNLESSICSVSLLKLVASSFE